MRSWKFLAPLVLCAALSVVTAGAVDFSLTQGGRVDMAAGAALITGEGGVDGVQGSPGSGLTEVSTGVWYDPGEGVFVVYAGSVEVRSNVISGMATREAVCISMRDTAASEENAAVPWNLYRNGQQLDPAALRLDYITTPGQYILEIESAREAGSYAFRFTIVGPSSNAMLSYQIPAGFSVLAATLDGQSVDTSSGIIDMTEEGLYEISYRCAATGRQYSLDFRADHTPPELALPSVKNGQSDGPVDLSDAEQGSTVTALLNGESIHVGKQLTQSGSYVLTITDEAGNSSTYEFRILLYFNSNSFLLFTLVLLTIGAVVGYMMWNRKNLRVR